MKLPNRLQRSAPYVAVAILFLLFVLGAGSMPYSIMPWQAYDDGLYLRFAHSLMKGQWLGPYDQLTLMKGPIFSAFLVLGHFTFLPLNVYEPTFYFAASLFLAWSIYRSRPSWWLFFGVLVACLLSPAVHAGRGRILRDFFFDAEIMFCLGLWFRLFLVPGWRPVLAIVSGVGAGLLWMTREESFVSLLPLIPLMIYGAVATLRRTAVKTIVLMAACAVSIGVVGYINDRVYGRFVVDEMTDGAFQKALVSLERVGVPFNAPYLPVPKAARDLIAAQSPMFAELRPILEHLDTGGFCTIMPMTCGDIAGGYFLWGLRDAAQRYGHLTSADAAATYWLKLAAEVNAACDQNKLICAGWLPQVVPPIPAQQWAKFPLTLWYAVQVSLYSLPFVFAHPASYLKMDGPENIALLNHPLIVDESGAIQEPPVVQVILRVWEGLITRLVSPYSWLNAAGLICAAIVVLLARYTWRDPLTWISASLLFTAASRLGLLVLVDISSFPVLSYDRFQIVNLALSAAAVVTIYQAVSIAYLYLAKRRRQEA